MTEETQFEFAVPLHCQACVDAIHKTLETAGGVELVSSDIANQRIIVRSSDPSTKIQKILENSGRSAILMGSGGLTGQNLGAAVSILSGVQGVLGVARFVQLNPDVCVIEGSLSGLSPGEHGLHVHELGDISDGCYSCGDHFNPDGKEHGAPSAGERHYGDLGNVTADHDGNAEFRIVDEVVKVWDIIGRSLIVDENADDLTPAYRSERRLGCGIIARSSGLTENVKKVCACSGKTVWDERKESILVKVPSSQL